MLDVDDVLELGEPKLLEWVAFFDWKNAQEEEAHKRAEREARRR